MSSYRRRSTGQPPPGRDSGPSGAAVPPGSGLLLHGFATAGPLSLPRHGHDDVHLCVVRGGRLLEADRRDEVEIVRGGTRISPAGDEHRIRFGPDGGACALLFVEQRFFDELSLELPTERRFGNGSRLLLDAVRRPLPTEPAPAPLRLQEAVVELLARGSASASAKGEVLPAWLSKIRDLLREAPEEVGRLSDLAAEAGVHPAHLTRAFRRHFGCSPSGYLRWRRAVKARRLVTASRESLSGIAHVCGFADQAHMTRSFRRLFGATPGRMRMGDVNSVQDS